MTFIFGMWFPIAAFAVAQQPVEQLNGVAAIVGNGVITDQQIDRQLETFKNRYDSQPGPKDPLPSDAVLKQQILQQMINRELQIQLAQNSGLTVSNAKLNEAIEQVAKGNHKSVRELYKAMEEQGYTVASFRDEIRDEILIQMVQGRDVASRINISEQAINDYLQRSKELQVEYHLGDILVALPAIPTPEQVEKAKAKAANIVSELNKGASFKHLAMADSSAGNALKGGDMGWRKLAEIPTLFAERVVSMNPGEVIGPLRAPNGFHVLKLFGVRNASLSSNKEERKKQVENLLFQQQFQQSLLTWLEQLRSQTYVKILIPQPENQLS